MCIPGSPADRGGMVAGAKVLAVGGRQFSSEVVRAAIREGEGRVGGDWGLNY